MEYQLNGDVAVLTFDDGKANAIGNAFMDAMIDGLSRAQQEAAAVVITGRAGLLSGGFDLKEIEKGAEAVKAMMKKGSNMFYRLFSHPQPLIIACTGHAIAAGAFLLLTADNRIGAAGDFKIGLNETAIGSTFPVFGIQFARTRLTPAYLTRSFVQSESFSPEEAMAAGFLDEVQPPESVMDTAMDLAQRLGKLPARVYAQNKLDIRKPAIDAIRASL
ncbi:MAG: crotonase/enoyl-CoA hydratase family protein [Gammaproteobacteria bacterium]|nr:MAG: crotonase/enoyl-CoA hydratase family protein [Gammaproteobacteria bacterium]